MIEEKDALNILEKRLSPQRFLHSVQVAAVARDMAAKYNLNQEKAYIAGLLHDYGKGISPGQCLRIATTYNLIEYDIEKHIPDILHAPVGAYLLRHELGIEDEEILKAVKNHTLGAIDMGNLDKIIYLADMIEPSRDFPGLDRLKYLAYRNLDEGMLFGLESSIKYCLDTRKILHPLTVEVRNNYLLKLNKK